MLFTPKIIEQHITGSWVGIFVKYNTSSIVSSTININKKIKKDIFAWYMDMFFLLNLKSLL